jgi:hypothetical protein
LAATPLGPHARYLAITFFVVMAFGTCLVASISWLGGTSKALASLAVIAAEQSSSPKSIWLGEIEDVAPYKIERAALTQPEIVVIGHSRCGQVRAEMFAPYKMYNACTSAWTFNQLIEEIDRLTTVAHPRVIMITLDYFMFTDAWADGYEKSRAGNYAQGLSAYLRRLRDLAKYTYDISARRPVNSLYEIDRNLLQIRRENVDNSKILGVHALRSEHGYRADGSTLYGPAYRSIIDQMNAQGAIFFMKSFPGAQDMSQRQINDLRKLAQLIHERGATFVGVQLPIARAAIDYLDTNEDWSGVWREFESEAAATMFRDMGITFFDLSRAAINNQPSHFIDPAHPNEGGIVAALLEIVDRSEFRRLFPLVDKGALSDTYQRAVQGKNLIDIYH